MTTNHRSEANQGESKSRPGKIFDDIDIDKAKPKATRKGKIFDVPPDETSTILPESISAGELLPNVADYSTLKLESLPLRGLKFFSVILLLALAAYAVLEFRDALIQAMDIHWAVAALFIGVSSVALFAGLYVLRELFFKKGEDGQIDEIRGLAADISLQHDGGKHEILLEKIDALYQNKPQNVHWQRCKEAIPDYANEREVLAHIERVYLRKLDREALRRISDHSVSIGVVVAASPWVSMDMILSFWRNMKMISDVAQVYGVRPSLKNRMQLIRRVFNHMVGSGVTELAVHQVVQDLGGQMTLGAVSARLAQGVGVGIYSAKIGVATMRACRPVDFDKENAPALPDIAGALRNRIIDFLSPKSNTKG